MSLASTNSDMERCIASCWECRTHCQETLFNYCLEKGGQHVNADHVRLMTDCMQICQTAADFMVRGSSLHASICAACADVCHACADSCEDIDDAEMQHCAQICRDCAELCDDMSLSDSRDVAGDVIEASITLI